MKWNLKVCCAVFLGLATAACSQDVNFDLGSKQDNFQQSYTYNNKVDILWIVDTSTSMDIHQEKLSSQIPALVEALDKIKMDYHIAVVTTSMGGTNPDGGQFIGTPKFLTAKSKDLVSSLRSRLILGTEGSTRERGLESLEMALSPNNLNGEGKGFFRKDALLAVIALSNEDDKSIYTDPAQHITNFLDTLKQPWEDGTRSWLFNFIGVLPNSRNCSPRGEHVEIGSIFIDISKRSGGIQASVCENTLATAVNGIRAKVTQILTDFKLTTKPDIATIVVKVNSIVIPRDSVNGWDYIESTNLIRFYGNAVPPADASINVDFKPAEAN